jgi:methyl-accepting chemotaxis protein
MKRFRNARTSFKLLAGFALVAALTVLVGIVGVTQIGQLDASVKSMYADSTVAISDLSHARSDLAEARAQALTAAVEGKPEPVAVAKAAWQEYIDDLKAAMDHYRSTDMTGRTEELAKFDQAIATYQNVSPEAWAICARGDLAAFKQLRISKLTQPATAATAALSNLAEIEDRYAKKAIDDAEAQARNAKLLMIGLIIVAALASIGLALGLGRMIVGPLQRTIDVLQRLARGELNQQIEVTTTDEAGQMSAALATALESLATTMRKIGEASQMLASSAEEFSAVSSQPQVSLRGRRRGVKTGPWYRS